MNLHNWYIDDEIRRRENLELANEIKRNREVERALAEMVSHPSPLSWLASWVNRIHRSDESGRTVPQECEMNACSPWLGRTPEPEA